MPVSSAQKREAFFMLSHAAFWGPQDERGLLCLIAEQLRIPNSVVREVLEQAKTMASHITVIDQQLEQVCTASWASIGYTEKTILRVIFFEKSYGVFLNDKILVSEAVRLANKFSGKQSGSFISGLLLNAFEKLNAPSSEKTDNPSDEELDASSEKLNNPSDEELDDSSDEKLNDPSSEKTDNSSNEKLKDSSDKAIETHEQ